MLKAVQNIREGQVIKMGKNYYNVISVIVVSPAFEDSKVRIMYETMKSGVTRLKEFEPGTKLEVIS